MRSLMIPLGLVLSAGLSMAGEAGFVTKLKAGEEQVMVTYGTSLTEKGAWVKQVAQALDQRFPGKAKVINSGGSGQWSQWGVKHLDQRVIAHQPDVVFIEFSINDSVARFKAGPELARENLENMIERILKARPACEIILMTMTPGNGPPEGHRSYRSEIGKHYEMYREVAKRRGLLLIDHDPHWRSLQREDPETFRKCIPDTIHPTAEGCKKVVTPEILKAIGLP